MRLFNKVTEAVKAAGNKATAVAGKTLRQAALGATAVAVTAKAAYYGLTLRYCQAAPFSAGNKYDASSDTTGLGNIIGYIMNGLTVGGVIFIIIGGISIAVSIKSGDQNRATRTYVLQ